MTNRTLFAALAVVATAALFAMGGDAIAQAASDCCAALAACCDTPMDCCP